MGRNANELSKSSVEFKNTGSYNSMPSACLYDVNRCSVTFNLRSETEGIFILPINTLRTGDADLRF